MAFSALNIAAQGLISSERRATELAQGIVSSSASAVSSVSDTLAAAEGTDVSPTPGVNAPAGGAPASPIAGGAGFGDVIQQLVDLRLEANVFRANAAAFSRIDETFGSLLDEEG